MPRKKNSKAPKQPPKKRGRKPKGGKIINSIKENKIVDTTTENIILHLKCNSSDINDSVDETNIKSFNIRSNKKNNMNFEVYSNKNNNNTNNTITKDSESDNIVPQVKVDVCYNEIWQKIRNLQVKLHKNDIEDKRSGCFWCTYAFDNPPFYIPKRMRNGTIEAYGCFCSPECAVAYLKNEKLNDSTMWERYSMLNNIYGKICDYEKNIKPAPNPYYTLDRFYGNLSIQEWRALLKSDRVLMVVDKPLTKIMPDMYEENNETPDIYSSILDNSSSSNKAYSLYRNKSVSSKKKILSNTFNLNNV